MVAGNKGSAKNIIFFGDDESFYESLKPRFVENYEQFQWEFHYIKEDLNEHVQIKLLDLIELKPVIIYFDFSCYSDRLKNLIEMVTKDSRFKGVAKVGLCEKKESCVKYTGLGLELIYVKGAELHDFVFGPICVAMPDVAQQEQFATAKCEESISLNSYGKIGFMTASYAHVEGNMILEQGARLYLQHNLDKSILPSSNFTVKVNYNYDLHYHFDYSYDLEFHYVDEPNLEDDNELMHSDGSDEEAMAQAEKLEEERARRQEEIESFDHRLKQTKKKFKEWVWDKVDLGKEKKLKVMVYDPKMRILGEEECQPLDSYPFSLRCFSKLSDDLDEIKKIRPGIIAIQLMGEIEFENREIFLNAIEAYKNKESMEQTGPPKAEWQMSEDEVELERLKKNLPELEADDGELVKRLIEKVKSIDNYSPIVVLLNSHLQSAAALQQTYQYSMLMTNESEISTVLIESMATMFLKKQQEKYETLMEQKLNQLKQKDPKKYQRFTIHDLKEKRYYVNKNDTLGIVRYGVPGMIVKMNESELVISSDSELKLGIYQIEEPFPMFLTFVPVEKGKPFVKERGTNFYRGLINGISEEDKKELRRYVNEVFFAPLEQQKAKELEDFQSLNELKLQERIEEEKRLEEERLAELNVEEEDENEEGEVTNLEGEETESVEASGEEAENQIDDIDEAS